MTAGNLTPGRFAITADGQIGRLADARTPELIRYVLHPLPSESGQDQFGPIAVDRAGMIMHTVDPTEVITFLIKLAAYASDNGLTMRARLPEQMSNPDTGWLRLLEYSDELCDGFIQVAAELGVRGYKALIIFYVLFGRRIDPGTFC